MLEFKAPDATRLSNLHASIVAELSGVGEASIVMHRCFFDTFDWRLFRHGYQLELARSTRHTELILSTASRSWSTPQACTPRFAAQLSEGPLRNRLTDLLDVRAMLPILTLRTHRARLRVENEDAKTVFGVHIDANHITPRGAASVRVVALPVRGYGKFEKRCRAILIDTLALQRTNESLYLEALRQLKRVPREPAPKRLAMTPVQRVDAAYKLFLSGCYDELTCNAPGVLEDVDTECLHEFRVALRKTRTTLRQCRGVFPSRVASRFRKEFSWLSAQTGELRDLDVHLLDVESYRCSVEQCDTGQLSALREHLRARRATSLKRLRSTLSSRRYSRLMSTWKAFLERPVPIRSVLRHATRPIAPYARERIWKAYKRVRRNARIVNKGDEPQALHDLRVSCKTLRYLIELHAMLFPQRRVHAATTRLRRLQKQLGKLQDLDVQAGVLHEFAAYPTPPPTSDSSHDLDKLLILLGKRTDKARARFESEFVAFESDKNRRRLRLAFKPDARNPCP